MNLYYICDYSRIIMIKRVLEGAVYDKLGSGKAIVILGPRQSGKTTLLKRIAEKLPGQPLWLNGDDPEVRQKLEGIGIRTIQQMFSGQKWIFIDEAQRIENIGLLLKMIVDNLPAIQIVATGSSAFELSDKIKEPLTGRKWEYHLLPISFGEMADHQGLWEESSNLESRLVYGYYPEVVTSTKNHREILTQLYDSYLYKDILSLEQIKKPSKIENLLKALAFQIGSEVSYNELSRLVELDKETVERYIHYLEQVFIIFRLPSFRRNLRSELKRSRKIYFYDNGIRNMIIANMAPVRNRQDAGALWENFLVSERIKFTHYNRLHANRYFWRTHAQQEIDYIEEYDGLLHAYEFKWNPGKKTHFSKTFTQAYKNSKTKVINRENYHEFLSLSVASK